MKKVTAVLCASVALAMTSPAISAQLTLTPLSVIGSTTTYSPDFNAGLIFDQQSGQPTDNFGQNYYLNTDFGQNPFITIDLGAEYSLSSVDLFNTHNDTYGDRGTGLFKILGSDSITPTTANGATGFTLAGKITTLVSGTLAAAPVSSPLADQNFTANSTAVRYIQFDPLSVASPNPPFTSDSVGLNELRVNGGPPVTSAVPEVATWAMMIGGIGMTGGALRRRKKVTVSKVSFA